MSGAQQPPYKGLRDLGPKDDNAMVEVAGWVEDVRNLGGVAFIILRQRDGTLQLTFKKKDNADVFARATSINRESVIAAEGKVVANKQARNGFEIFPAKVEVLSAAEAPLPLGVADKVGAELDTRLDNRFMDLRKPERRAIFAVRSLALKSIREYMSENRFVEVHTPKLAGAGAEGGASLFETDYFGKRAFLSQSPQLYKQMLMATGFDRVFEISPAFRAEPSDTIRHITEFVSFDAEVAFIRHQEDFLKMFEECIVRSISYVKEHGKEFLEKLGIDPKVPSLPIPRLMYVDAISILQENGKKVREGDDIDTEGEKIIGKVMLERGHELYYLRDYPSAIKAFYVMPKADDPEYSNSFDMEYKGMEMASGGQREHRYGMLVERMKSFGLDPANFDFYLKPFRYGMPPHGGWGFGIDRFIQQMLDLPNIREAVLFPRDRNRLIP